MLDFTELGGFTLTSEDMYASDPCYQKPYKFAGAVHNCLSGRWEAAVVRGEIPGWGERVLRLCVRHESVPDFELCDEVRVKGKRIRWRGYDWADGDMVVGVNSAQAGFFDAKFYGTDKGVAGLHAPCHNFGSKFYNHCCDRTFSEVGAGVLPYGAVSSSGCWDGIYTVLVHRNQDRKADCLMLIF